MQNIIPLILGAFVVYFLFFRKGGMGMGCCGSHGSHGRQSSHDRHGGHGHELDQDRHYMNGPKMEKRTSSISGKISIPY